MIHIYILEQINYQKKQVALLTNPWTPTVAKQALMTSPIHLSMSGLSGTPYPGSEIRALLSKFPKTLSQCYSH